MLTEEKPALILSRIVLHDELLLSYWFYNILGPLSWSLIMICPRVDRFELILLATFELLRYMD